MANHSDAFGTVCITAPTLQILKDFVYLWGLQDAGAYYNVSVYDAPQTDSEWASMVSVTGGQVEISLSWVGTGRWSIQNNFDWLMSEIMTPQGAKDKERIALADVLSNYPVTMYFEYSEDEPGQVLLECGAVQIEWDPIRKDQLMDVLGVERLDYTVENLVAYGFYSPYDIIDGEWIVDHWDEYKDDLLTNDDLSVVSKIDNNVLKSIIRNTKGVYSDIDELIDRVTGTQVVQFTIQNGQPVILSISTDEYSEPRSMLQYVEY